MDKGERISQEDIESILKIAFKEGLEDGTASRVLAFHAADQSSMPSFTYGPLSTARGNF